MDKGGSNCGDKQGVGNGRVILWRVIQVYQDFVKDLHPSWISPPWILVREKGPYT